MKWIFLFLFLIALFPAYLSLLRVLFFFFWPKMPNNFLSAVSPLHLETHTHTHTHTHILFSIGDWNAKVISQEIPGVTGKFGFGAQKEVRQWLTEFCQENTLVIASTFYQKHKR